MDETPTVQKRNYTVIGTVTRNGQPITNVTLELRSTVKTAVTDVNGKVAFYNVNCGKHSLTAIKNGKVIGYFEFMLSESTAANFGLENNGIYVVTANRNEIGIDLTLNLTNDGIQEIKDIQGVSENKTPIRVVDTSNVFLWTILLIMSCIAIGTTVVIRMKRCSR